MIHLTLGIAMLSGITGSMRVDIDAALVQNKFGGDRHAAESWARSLDLALPVEFRMDEVRAWSHTPFVVSEDSFTTLLSYEQFVIQWPEHTVSVLLTGAGLNGSVSKGAAMQNSACDYGVAVVYVPYDAPDAFARARTLSLMAHEIGHTFDLDHTHCQNPPVDTCWSGGGFLGQFGSSCYRGPTTCPASGRGTAMSICYDGPCTQVDDSSLHESQAVQMLAVVAQKNCLEFSDGFE